MALHQAVPDSLFGWDDIGQAHVCQFFSQTRHIDRQGIVIDKQVAVPELFHQVLTADDNLRSLKQYPQDLKFIFGQFICFSSKMNLHGF